MAARPAARAVLLYSDLEPFVMSCLASQNRRTWTRGRVPAFQKWDTPDFIRNAPIEALPDGEVAACLWVLHMSLFANLARHMPERFLPIDCEELLNDPASTAGGVARFLDLPADHAGRQAETSRRVHAKTGVRYGAEDRLMALRALRTELMGELEHARRWCRTAGVPIAGRAFFAF